MSPFGSFLDATKSVVEASLASWLDGRAQRYASDGSEAAAVLAAVRDLALRGGKRLRPALLAAAYEGCGGEGGASRVAMAGVALELLQTYLLVHDDWMDDDDVRRGGPSVHALLRERFGSKAAGDAGAILAGDMACALAQDALLEVPVPPARLVAAARAFTRMQQDVIVGQLRDLHGAVDVLRTHELKTASYTTVGPLAVGAALAGASNETSAAFERFAIPLGIAFQVRDDLLGVFGDARATGKPVLRDLAQGKRTALLAEVDGDREAQALVASIRADAADTSAQLALAERLVTSGAKERTESKLAALLSEARALLESISLDAHAKSVLHGAIDALGERDR